MLGYQNIDKITMLTFKQDSIAEYNPFLQWYPYAMLRVQSPTCTPSNILRNSYANSEIVYWQAKSSGKA